MAAEGQATRDCTAGWAHPPTVFFGAASAGFAGRVFRG